MKIENSSKLLDTNLSSTSTNFSVKNNSKMFSILSDNLYTDKIGSIVRELASNAIDSHIEANNPSPFEITLPNELESVFAVTDYGIGLSKESLIGLYTQYGESTKNGSNELIGGFGLGSKSPFAYAKSFKVVSCYNGMRYTALVFFQEDGIPCLNIIDEQETGQKNGVSVSFSVKKEDFTKFKDAVHKQLKYIKSPFMINGTLVDNSNMYDEFGYLKSFLTEESYIDEFHIDHILSIEEQNKLSCRIFKKTTKLNSHTWLSSGYGKLLIRLFISGICYSITDKDLEYIYKNNNELELFLTYINAKGCIDLYYNIGDIDLTASREKVAMSPKTYKRLQTSLTAISSAFFNKLYTTHKNDPYMFKIKILTTIYDNIYFKADSIKTDIQREHKKLSTIIDKYAPEFAYIFDFSKNIDSYKKELNIILATGTTANSFKRDGSIPAHKNTSIGELLLAHTSPCIGFPYRENYKNIPEIYLNDTSILINNTILEENFNFGDIIVKPRSGVSEEKSKKALDSFLHDLGNPVLHKVSEKISNETVDISSYAKNEQNIRFLTWIKHFDGMRTMRTLYSTAALKNKTVVYVMLDGNYNTCRIDNKHTILNRIFINFNDRNITYLTDMLGDSVILIGVYKTYFKALINSGHKLISFEDYLEESKFLSRQENARLIDFILNDYYKVDMFRQINYTPYSAKKIITILTKCAESKTKEVIDIFFGIKNPEIHEMFKALYTSLLAKGKSTLVLNTSNYEFLLKMCSEDTIKDKKLKIEEEIKNFAEKYEEIFYLTYPTIYDNFLLGELQSLSKIVSIINKLY